MKKLLSMQGRTPTDDVTLTKDEYARLSKIMWTWFWRSPRGWLLMSAITLAPLAVFALLLVAFYRVIQPMLTPSVWTLLIVPLFLNGVISSVVVLLGAYIAIRLVWEPRYRVALREIGYDLCDGCDYRMDGIDAAAPCPECGAAREAMP